MTLPRVLLAESHKYFRANMDRNYAHKHAAACAGLREMLTVADVSEAAPADVDPRSHDILLVGVFASNPDPTDPPGSGVPPSWAAQIAKRCVMVEDVRMQTDLAAFLHAYRCQYLVATYECAELAELRTRCPLLRRVFVVPHHIDTSLYRRLDVPKVYDVVLYGSTHPGFYPFRRRLAALLQASSLRTMVVDYPGRSAFDPQRCGEALVRLINQSWIGVATPTTSGYLVAKYFEISACGTLVAGSIPAQGLPVWGDCSVLLEESMSDGEILGLLERALADKEELGRKAALAHDRVQRGYSLEHYVNRLREALLEIAADQPAGMAG
jgi:hypothetical protein